MTSRKWNATQGGVAFGAPSFNPGASTPAHNRLVRKHLIAMINYSTGKPTPEAPMLCICGWQGVSEGWEEHKREARR